MSIQSKLYTVMVFIVIILSMAALNHYLRRVQEATAQKLNVITECDQKFSDILLSEQTALSDASHFNKLSEKYTAIRKVGRDCHSESKISILMERQAAFNEVFRISREAKKIYSDIKASLLDLFSSVKYIHEHHMTFLKNLIQRKAPIKNYNTDAAFERSATESAAEPDIIKSAIAIQTSLLSIYNTFYNLQQGEELTNIKEEFSDRIKQFFLSVNTFEDYTLDSQDGILVEELLQNGRQFENLFIHLLASEQKKRILTKKLEQNKAWLIKDLNEAKSSIKTESNKTFRQINIIQIATLVSTLLLGFWIVLTGRQIIRQVKRTIVETNKIQKNLSYQIKIDDSILDEFKVGFEALNSMASEASDHINKLDNAHAELEIRVKERTIELAKTNEALRSEITDRKQAEKERRKLESKLQQAQKMESIGTLAGGIAHDFNNILYSIIGYTELTLDDLPEDSQAKKNLKEVFKGALRAKDMVQQILAFSRKAETVKMPIQIQSIIKEAIKLLRTSIPSTIEIRQNINMDCGPVMADSTQIHQVIMNLSTNAYQAMREKGGVLELTLVEAEIDSDDLDRSLPPGTYLKLTVADTGHGMDTVVMEKIFNPYFSTKKPGEGTGMGLAVVYGIIKDHGGDIRVYSKVAKGTTFDVYFPVIETRPIEPKTLPEGAAPTGTEHILLVDDEESIVFMIQQMLERLGYQVTSRTSSVEALEAFRAKQDKVDLVITDMTMPYMTGVEFASKLKEIKSDIPIIICTGFSEVMDEKKAKNMGILAYIMKPVIKDEMAKTIRKVLDEVKER